MANSNCYSSLLFFACLMAVLSLMLNPALSDNSPSLAPELAAADSPSPAPSPSSSSSSSPSPSPSPSPLPSLAPMAPSPHIHYSAPASASSALPSSPPAPPPAHQENSPAPAPTVNSAVGHNGLGGGDTPDDSSSKGMSGGKKAGIAFGVMLSVCVVGLAGFVYKKRQQNIRRAQFGYAARRGFL